MEKDRLLTDEDGYLAASGVKTCIWTARRKIEKECPKCREASLAITKLDEAAMWYDQIPVPIDDPEWEEILKNRNE